MEEMFHGVKSFIKENTNNKGYDERRNKISNKYN